jgi:hypothetical protein
MPYKAFLSFHQGDFMSTGGRSITRFIITPPDAGDKIALYLDTGEYKDMFVVNDSGELTIPLDCIDVLVYNLQRVAARAKRL